MIRTTAVFMAEQPKDPAKPPRPARVREPERSSRHRAGVCPAVYLTQNNSIDTTDERTK